MTFLKSLWSDLVEKKLWPVALVLLVALVAVPLTLGAPAEEPTASAPGGATGGEGATGLKAITGQIAFEPAFPVRLDRAGKVRDPFVQRAIARTRETLTTSVTAPTAQSAPQSTTAGGAPSGPSGGGGLDKPPSSTTAPAAPDTTPKPPAKATPADEPRDSYVVALRFGREGVKRAPRQVARLSPLPSAESPFFVYLGVLGNEKTVVFLLSSEVTATGEGTCKPNKLLCERLEMVRGETEILEVKGADGKLTRYRLDVDRVLAKATLPTGGGVLATSAAGAGGGTDAAAARAAADELGTDAYVYDEATGKLKRVIPVAGAEKRSAADTEPAAPETLVVTGSRPGWGTPLPLPAVLQPPSVAVPQP